MSIKVQILYITCNIALLKRYKSFAYTQDDLLKLIELFINPNMYINRCLDCFEDIGVPRQLCGYTKCTGVPLDITDDHFG